MLVGSRQMLNSPIKCSIFSHWPIHSSLSLSSSVSHHRLVFVLHQPSFLPEVQLSHYSLFAFPHPPSAFVLRLPPASPSLLPSTPQPSGRADLDNSQLLKEEFAFRSRPDSSFEDYMGLQSHFTSIVGPEVEARSRSDFISIWYLSSNRVRSRP